MEIVRDVIRADMQERRLSLFEFHTADEVFTTGTHLILYTMRELLCLMHVSDSMKERWARSLQWLRSTDGLLGQECLDL